MSQKPDFTQTETVMKCAFYIILSDNLQLSWNPHSRGNQCQINCSWNPHGHGNQWTRCFHWNMPTPCFTVLLCYDGVTDRS